MVISEKERIATIKANIDLVYSHEIDKMYKKVVRARVKADYKVTLEESDINTGLSLGENWKKYLDEKIVPRYGNLETYQKYLDFSML